MRNADPPTLWFWKLEVALHRGNAKAAARARLQLAKLGFNVTVKNNSAIPGKPATPDSTSQEGGGQ